MTAQTTTSRSPLHLIITCSMLCVIAGCNLSDPEAGKEIYPATRIGLGDMSSTPDMSASVDMTPARDLDQPVDMPGPIDMVDMAPIADMSADMPPACAPTCGPGEVCLDGACCSPDTCESLGCGVHETCGQALDCGECECAPDNFLADCPDRPCERLTGCDAVENTCQYEPVVCAGLICACDKEGGCTDQDLYRCVEAGMAPSCPAIACDPAPTMAMDGTILYANQCVSPDQASCEHPDVCVGAGTCLLDTCAPTGCGVCELGRWQCNQAMDGPECDEIDFSSLMLPTIDCEGGTQTSTFVYVDPLSGDDVNGDGGRVVPFKTLEKGLLEASSHAPAVVIISRSEVLPGPVDLPDGVSIIGGFGPAPRWERDPMERPTIATAMPSPDGNIFGLRADNITSPTLIKGVAISTGDAGPAGSAYGIWLHASPGVMLDDVDVTTGRGGDGASGLIGSTGEDGEIGADGQMPMGAPETVNTSCPIANGGAGGRGRVCAGSVTEGTDGQDSPAGLSGGNYDPNDVGSPGAGASGTEPRGVDGTPVGSNAQIIAGLWTPAEDTMDDGLDGSHGRGGGGGSGSGCAPFGTSIGGGGGAGASGGCGGGGGKGGASGGGSFGIFLVDAGMTSISNARVLAGEGGPGGPGGQGGDGGQAGPRGGFPGPFQGAAGQGGAGGTASGGGDGGHGAGGPGGPSVAIYCENSTPTLAGMNDLTASAGGPGGSSPGEEGLDGASANTMGCSSGLPK